MRSSDQTWFTCSQLSSIKLEFNKVDSHSHYHLLLRSTISLEYNSLTLNTTRWTDTLTSTSFSEVPSHFTPQALPSASRTRTLTASNLICQRQVVLHASLGLIEEKTGFPDLPGCPQAISDLIQDWSAGLRAAHIHPILTTILLHRRLVR